MKKNQQGSNVIELIIVLLIIAIIAVIAMPQVISAKRLWHFSGFQRQVVTCLREARQEAISQRTPITFQYDDSNKKLVLYGGAFGSLGDSRNRVYPITSNFRNEIIYGKVAGASAAALSNGINLTDLNNQKVEIRFQSDGSVIDSANNLQNTGLFFYNVRTSGETAFAISILGAGGMTKVWRFNQTNNTYVE